MVPHKRGFTVIEALIVMALVGMLFTALFTSYMQVKRLLVEQTGNSRKNEEIMSFLKILSADLQNMINEPWNTRQIFIGRRNMMQGIRIDQLIFTTGNGYANPSTLQTQVRTVAYEAVLDESNNKVYIVRREDQFADYVNPGNGIPVPLVSDPEEFALSFSQTGQDWSDDWDYVQRRAFPRYIKCVIKWKEGAETREMTTEIRPPVMWY